MVDINDAGINWAPVQDDDVRTITLPNKAAEVVVLYYITDGIESAALDAAKSRIRNAANRGGRRARKGDEATNEMFFDTGAYRSELLKRVIKSWTFKDKAGKPLPCNDEQITRLPAHTRDYIMEDVDAFSPQAADEEEAEDLGRSSQSSSDQEEAPTGSPSQKSSETSG